ncbi:valine--tRNA ligase [Neoroseomonas lacus]|uniref:Valine--tRNA ligase n=1 Tax=Neoroseomonas lacus TaxID=287609 RepID=A0A917K3F2_9PROT|nr:valine--tRNA ligase [Neoroseomonas lacus]GGI99393.1 valine--tRNA ligase [Neoroseomonas lacus]
MLDKSFDPAAIEQRLYEGWEGAGAFSANPASPAKPFTIMIPPPNVTGSLHIGHALDNTLQDILIRWRRMQGRDALWQPGTDHAGIATQMVVERLLVQEGNADRRSLGRENFVKRIWEWKAESGGTITRQLRRLGASLDWPRERFTMDEGLSVAVREVFVRLYRDGLLYRDKRLVNWDPKFLTAISDLEVESKEVKGHLWHLRYPIEGEPGRFLVVATTRPETMLGDTAVAVHPEDERFRSLVGKRVILPLVGRSIPVVADEYSDPEKGSGAVKITPAHDFNDFELGKRHDLPMPSVLDAEGRVFLDEIAGAFAAVDGVSDLDFVRGLAGQDRFAARKSIVARLEEMELVEAIEPHTHAVPHGDRSGVPIEPRLTMQWYVDAKTLAAPAIKAVETGQTVFTPKQWENTFFAWMRDIQPWCVSRQLWWGHQIPAWYAPDGEVFVAFTEAEAADLARVKFGRDVELVRDEDVLDTWFSSALWPFSTIGWPEKTPELAKYYPGDVLVTGFDIIFFWVARMMMMGIHFMGETPFKTVCIHGLVRDEKGQKMSKSRGNVMDPLELVDAYGADAVRFTLCALAGPGRDIKLAKQRIEGYRAFATKIWNASRFCEMNGIAPRSDFDASAVTLPLSRWILDAANSAVAEANASLEAFRFDDYAGACYRFTWNTFCDWFLEFAKPVLLGPDGAEKEEVKGVAQHVLGTVLRLLHPVMPFLTEELWHRLGYGAEGSLIREAWPEAVSVEGVVEARAELDWVVGVVSEIRSIRSDFDIGYKIKGRLAAHMPPAEEARLRDRLTRHNDILQRLGGLSAVEPASTGTSSGAEFAVSGDRFDLQFGDDFDFASAAPRLEKEFKRVAGEAQKAEAKLSSEVFISRAPEEIVQENRDRLAAAQTEMARLQAAIARITG